MQQAYYRYGEIFYFCFSVHDSDLYSISTIMPLVLQGQTSLSSVAMGCLISYFYFMVQGVKHRFAPHNPMYLVSFAYKLDFVHDNDLCMCLKTLCGSVGSQKLSVFSHVAMISTH